MKIKNLLILILFVCIFKSVQAQKIYFDLSQKQINIDTNFTGKELILFGLAEPNYDIVIVVSGPKKDLTIRNKNRILGLWFNTKSITYINVPKVYFISSYKDINDVINQKSRFNNEIGFNNIKLIPKNKKDLFVDLKNWNESLIRVQKQKNLYKHFDLKIVDERLFQTKLYFPSHIPMGKYDVTTYKIKDGKIVSSSNRIILINKSGIGNEIYLFAKNHSIYYGIGTIFLALILGIAGAAIFRKL